MTLIQIIVLSIGLSMDSAAVSMTNGLVECQMPYKKTLLIALTFGLFQGIMPLIGYLTGSAFASFFTKFMPYAALILLSLIGIKMIVEALKSQQTPVICLRGRAIIAQGFTTSIDALAIGLVFVGQKLPWTLFSFLIIGITTFLFSVISVIIGKKCGLVLKKKAQIFGGIILIAIGLKIFLQFIL